MCVSERERERERRKRERERSNINKMIRFSSSRPGYDIDIFLSERKPFKFLISKITS